MTINVTQAEVEVLINQRLQTGDFVDAEDVVLQALRHSPRHAVSEGSCSSQQESIVELFAPLRGLNFRFDEDRKHDLGRDIEL